MKVLKEKAEFIPSRLVQQRERLGFSQTRMAQLLGISLPAYNQWERGESKPDSQNLALLCKLTKSPAEHFFNIPENLFASQMK